MSVARHFLLCVTWAWLATANLAVADAPADASAGALLELSIEKLDFEQGSVDQIQVYLSSDPQHLGLSASIAEISSADLEKPIKDLQLDCPQALVDWPSIQCESATLVLGDSPWGRQRVEAALDWQSAEEWRLSFAGLRYAGDRISGHLSSAGDVWQLHAKAGALQLRNIQPLRDALAEAGLTSISGVSSLQGEVRGEGGRITSLQASGSLRGLAWSDDEGLQAAENVRVRYDLDLSSRQADWSGRVSLQLLSGEVYSDPVFMDLQSQPLRASTALEWDAATERLRLSRLSLDAGKLLKVSGQAIIDTGVPALRSGEVTLKVDDLATGYSGFFQPLLIGTGLDEMELLGKAEGQLSWRDGELHALSLQLRDLYFADLAGSFGASGLGADIRWQQTGEVAASQVQWQGFQLGKLDFGPAELDFRAVGSHLHLLNPLSIPFYQGQIRIQDLTWVSSEAGNDAGFSLSVDNVSLEALSEALEWPLMSGRINGNLPGARYANDALRVDGDIGVEAFDGRLTLRNLQLEQISSAAPVLEAALELRGLDLAKVTETFSFGRIRGRLDGEVSGLQLVAWEPNRFDAHFRSPENDDLPHKISQRAVEDLTELGNGVSGALASPFLQIFKEFSYDRVELIVRQRGDRAEIGGIPHSSGGYYLVKGAGIPRIDVIGRNREVAWNDLVERLRSIRVDGIEVE